MLLFAQLTTPYAAAQATEDAREFLSAIFEYADALKSNYYAVIDALDDMEIDETENERIARDVALAAIDKHFQTLLPKVADVKSLKKKVDHIVKWYTAALEHSPEVMMSMRMGELHRLAELLGFKENPIQVPEYGEWHRYNGDLEAGRQVRVWYSWERIKQLSNARRPTRFKFQPTQQRESDAKAIDLIIDRRQPNPDLLFEFKIHLRRVHAFVRDYVRDEREQEGEEAKGKASSIHTWRFDNGSSTLVIGGINIRFNPGSNRAAVMQILAKAPGKIWPWDEVYDRMRPDVARDDRFRTEADSKMRDKVLEALRGIQRQIAKMALINDFLIFDSKTSRINKKYRFEK